MNDEHSLGLTDNFLKEELNTVHVDDKGKCCIAKITNKIKIETSVNIIRNAN